MLDYIIAIAVALFLFSRAATIAQNRKAMQYGTIGLVFTVGLALIFMGFGLDGFLHFTRFLKEVK